MRNVQNFYFVPLSGCIDVLLDTPQPTDKVHEDSNNISMTKMINSQGKGGE